MKDGASVFEERLFQVRQLYVAYSLCSQDNTQSGISGSHCGCVHLGAEVVL